MKNEQIPEPRAVIKAAVVAAGGAVKIAEAFQISDRAPTAWVLRSYVPTQYVRQLSEMGGGTVSVDALLAACERSKLERAAA